MKLIIGLGNPEPEFSGTRHNVGKEVLNIYADKIGESWEFNKKVNAWIKGISLFAIIRKILPQNKV